MNERRYMTDWKKRLIVEDSYDAQAIKIMVTIP